MNIPIQPQRPFLSRVAHGLAIAPLLLGMSFGTKAFDHEPQTTWTGLTTTLAPAAGMAIDPEADRSFHSDIAFFEAAFSYGTMRDPRGIFLMVNAYLAANQQAYGIEFFERYLGQYGEDLSPEAHAHTLAATAILRATYADRVFLLKRIGWVQDTFELLEQADQMTNGEDPWVHWASGLVYAQVPGFFFKRDEAIYHLTWLTEREHLEPVWGFSREVYYHLGRLMRDRGDEAAAKAYLARSGFAENRPASTFMGWFTSSVEHGTAMVDAPTLVELVKDRVFALYGFGFSDIFFVQSEDRRELIAIDAGTRPDLTRAAHQLLTKERPGLPPITTLIVTHAHWDHIGGHLYYRELNPDLTIYGRENYASTLDRAHRNHAYKSFRSAMYQHSQIVDYAPDVAVPAPTTLEIGGTELELIPVAGGETEDALFIHLPDESVMFVGDFLMPYYGEPWVEEGLIDEAIDAMAEVTRRQPDLVLHGHQPLTVLYQAKEIAAYGEAYQWLVAQTRRHLKEGYSVKDIVRLNLIPPSLASAPNIMLQYYDPRDHIIARVADNMLGYWREDIEGAYPEGLDTLTVKEYGRMLELYFGLSHREVANGLEAMINNGDNELALQMAVAAQRRYGDRSRLVALKQLAAQQLQAKTQFLDPFKFTVYGEMAGRPHRPQDFVRIVEGPTQ